MAELYFISSKNKSYLHCHCKGHLIVHPKLVSEGRKKQKTFYIDPAKDIDVKSLEEILKLACGLYK